MATGFATLLLGLLVFAGGSAAAYPAKTAQECYFQDS